MNLVKLALPDPSRYNVTNNTHSKKTCRVITDKYVLRGVAKISFQGPGVKRKVSVWCWVLLQAIYISAGFALSHVSASKIYHTAKSISWYTMPWLEICANLPVHVVFEDWAIIGYVCRYRCRQSSSTVNSRWNAPTSIILSFMVQLKYITFLFFVNKHFWQWNKKYKCLC